MPPKKKLVLKQGERVYTLSKQTAKSMKVAPKHKAKVSEAKAHRIAKQEANKAINKSLESKYFDVNTGVQDELFHEAWYVNSTNRSDIGVQGYQTGYNREIANNEIRMYGVDAASGDTQPITNLKMNRIFQNNETDLALKAFMMEGQKLRPSYAETKWLLQANCVDVSSDCTLACPYRVRMIRVRPNLQKTSYQQVNPEQDLFLDNYGQPFGIQSTNASGSYMFDRLNFHTAKVNSGKERTYTLIADKTFTIMPPSTFAKVAAKGNSADQSDAVGTNSGGCIREIHCNHRIADKKGGTLTYFNAQDTSTGVNGYPDEGFSNEFILFHTIRLGNPGPSGSRVIPGSLTVSCRPVSTFKDG